MRPLLLYVLILLGVVDFLRAQSTVPPDIDLCPNESTTDASGTHILWTTINGTSNSVPAPINSSPICLDADRLLITRNCTSNGWLPADIPTCAFTQTSFERSNQCPLGYTSLPVDDRSSSSLCVLVTSAQAWNNTCLSAGSTRTVLDLDERERNIVYDHLIALGIQRVWMPACRFIDFGPIAWQLAGRNFGESVEFDDVQLELDEQAEFEKRGCFSLNVTSRGRSGADEDCDRPYPILCVYQEKDPLLRLACPRGFASTRYQGMQDTCVGVQRINVGEGAAIGRMEGRQRQYNWVESECRGELYSLDSVEKTVLFQQSADDADLDATDRCLVGVLPNVLIESMLEWSILSPFVDFVNWAAPRYSGNLITADRLGKWHWSDDFTCIACSRPVKLLPAHIDLKFYDDHLYAVVYNHDQLWRERTDEPGFKCFTDSDNELIRSVKVEGEVWSGVMDDTNFVPTTIRHRTRTVFELRTYGDGPGYYWCRGHAIPDFGAVQSTPVVAHKHLKGDVFAVLMETHCNECRHYFQNKCIKEMAHRFKSQLNRMRKRHQRHQQVTDGDDILEQLSVENVRVMKIHEIDIARNASSILFHVTLAMDHMDYDDDSEEDTLDLSADLLHIYKMRNYLQHILTTSSSIDDDSQFEFQFKSLNSTEYCLPDSLSATPTDALTWTSAKIGQIAAPKELCLHANGLPVRRRCVGDFIYGGRWLNVSRTQACTEEKRSPITQSLYEIDQQYSSITDTSAVIRNVTELMRSANHSTLIAADLFYLGRVMHTINRFNELQHNSRINGSTALTTPLPTLLHRTESEHIFAIYNRLMFVNESTTRLAAALNSTNVLLEALDKIVNCMSSDNLVALREAVNLTENKIDGTIAMRSPRLLVYVIDPTVRNLSGIALTRRAETAGGISGEADDDLLDYDVRLLSTNELAAELLNDELLEVAAFVPATLLARLGETRNMAVAVANTTTTETMPRPLPLLSQQPLAATPSAPPVRVVITIYFNDLLFQEFRDTTFAKVDGKIISVSIPGYGPILPELLPIFLKTKHFQANQTDTNTVCGYWDFQSDTWSRDGCEFGGSSATAREKTVPTVMCACSHLTHFAYLVMGTYFHSMPGDDDVIVIDMHQDVLDMITLLGCSLSLAGIAGIGVTALVFPTWREKASAKVLLHLSASIALQMILICFVNTEVRSMYLFLNQQWYGCVAMGAMLHYSVLVAFMWMLITAYLQFMRYVRVIGPARSNRFFLKSTLFGWGVPLIPVCVVVGVAPNSYIPNLEQIEQGICYPTGYSLYLGVIVPMGIIVTANLIIFVLVIYNIVRGPDGKLRNSSDRDLTMAQLRLSVLLFFLLGLTWIFGLCASTQVGLVFSYLFCLTATLQGFVLFLYFIILDPITRNLWGQWLRRYVGCVRSSDDLK